MAGHRVPQYNNCSLPSGMDTYRHSSSRTSLSVDSGDSLSLQQETLHFNSLRKTPGSLSQVYSSNLREMEKSRNALPVSLETSSIHSHLSWWLFPPVPWWSQIQCRTLCSLPWSSLLQEKKHVIDPHFVVFLAEWSRNAGPNSSTRA